MIFTHKNITLQYNKDQVSSFHSHLNLYSIKASHSHSVSMFLHHGFLLLQIIHVNLTQENPKPLEVGKTLDMTYSVKWTETNITFARRFDVYLDYHFFEHQVNTRSTHLPSFTHEGITVFFSLCRFIGSPYSIHS